MGNLTQGKLEDEKFTKRLPLAQQNAHPVLSWILLNFPFHIPAWMAWIKHTWSQKQPNGIYFCHLCPVSAYHPLPSSLPPSSVGPLERFKANFALLPIPEAVPSPSKMWTGECIVSQRSFILTYTAKAGCLTALAYLQIPFRRWLLSLWTRLLHFLSGFYGYPRVRKDA